MCTHNFKNKNKIFKKEKFSEPNHGLANIWDSTQHGPRHSPSVPNSLIVPGQRGSSKTQETAEPGAQPSCERPGTVSLGSGGRYGCPSHWTLPQLSKKGEEGPGLTQSPDMQPALGPDSLSLLYPLTHHLSQDTDLLGCVFPAKQSTALP